MNKLETEVIYSVNYNPWFNMALEEYLLHQVEENKIILYLWQNENTVVIGRNQNAWQACCCTCLERDGGNLARRLSGGGAVYHDLGNQNFTFITRLENFNKEKQLAVILDAVKELGIEAELTQDDEFFCQNKKFAGNAYYFSAEAAYHHGSILVNTNMKRLNNHLSVAPDKLYAKGIERARDKVINLGDVKEGITVEDIQQSIIASFYDKYGEAEKSPTYVDPELKEEVCDLYRKYASWEWRFGKTPDFDMTFETRFSWGRIELGLKLEEGRIADTSIYSDAMNVHLIKEVEEALRGCTLNLTAMYHALEELVEYYGEEEKIMELAEWLRERDL